MAIAPKLLAYMEMRGVAFDIVRHVRSDTAAQSAEYAQVDAEHLAKGVLLVDERGYQLAVVPTAHWVTLDRINRELGRSLELASEAEVERAFPDCRPGAVPACGSAYGIPCLLDLSLQSLAYVYIEAGDHEQLLAVSQDGFAALMKGARQGHYSSQA